MTTQVNFDSIGGGGSSGAYYCMTLTNSNNTQYTVWSSVTKEYTTFAHSAGGTKVDDDNVKIEYQTYHTLVITFKKAGYLQKKSAQTAVAYTAGQSVTISSVDFVDVPIFVYFE